MTNNDSQESAEYYLNVIQRAGMERITELSVKVLWLIRKEPFLDLTGDHFFWPYDGDKRGFTLVDELIWVMHEAGHELFEDNYRPALRPYCEGLVKTLQDGEQDLLIVAVNENSDAAKTHWEQLDRITMAIETEVLRLAANHDRQTFDDQFVERGFPWKQEPELPSASNE